jgi:hypothetical protein
METVIFRKSWITAAKRLTDAQFREFITKISEYGFNECETGLNSDDEIVSAMLAIVAPSMEQSVTKYLDAQ